VRQCQCGQQAFAPCATARAVSRSEGHVPAGLARYRCYFPRSTSSHAVGPLKNHQSGPPIFSPCASPLRGSAQCWLLRRCRQVPWQPRTRQRRYTRATTPTDAARKVQRRMLGRVSVEQDTLLRGGLGDSPGVARQVRSREGDHLPQGSSHTRTHTPTRQRGSPTPPLSPFFFLPRASPSATR
jgi:hypothetical protein